MHFSRDALSTWAQRNDLGVARAAQAVAEAVALGGRRGGGVPALGVARQLHDEARQPVAHVHAGREGRHALACAAGGVVNETLSRELQDEAREAVAHVRGGREQRDASAGWRLHTTATGEVGRQ